MSTTTTTFDEIAASPDAFVRSHNPGHKLCAALVEKGKFDTEKLTRYGAELNANLQGMNIGAVDFFGDHHAVIWEYLNGRARAQGHVDGFALITDCFLAVSMDIKCEDDEKEFKIRVMLYELNNEYGQEVP